MAKCLYSPSWIVYPCEWFIYDSENKLAIFQQHQLSLGKLNTFDFLLNLWNKHSRFYS